MPKTLLRRLWLLPRNLMITLISFYQATFSPDHGPLRHLYPYGYCRHHPTCSEYGKNAMQGRGLVIGSFLTMKRLLSCHPWRTPDEERLRQAIAATEGEKA